MRALLKGLALVVVGFTLSIIFQNTITLQYVHVFQTPEQNNQRQVSLSLQPFHESPVTNLFEKQP